MFTSSFWRATLERSISTGAQFVLGVLVGDLGQVLQVDPILAIKAFIVGFILSVLKALVAASMSSGSGPGFGDAEALTGR